MTFTIPTGLRDVWAKSPSDGETSGETLVEHTYRVLERVSDQYRLRPDLGTRLESDVFWHRAFWAGFFHDFGKAANGFQRQLRPQAEQPWRRRHEVLSLAFVGWVFPKESDDWIWIVSTIVSHHRDLDYIRRQYPLNLDPEYDVLGDMIREISEDAIEALWVWTANAPADLVEQLGLQNAGILFPDVIPLETPEEFYTRGLERARQALANYPKFSEELEDEGSETLKTLRALSHRGVMMTADHAGSAHTEAFLGNPIPEPDDLVQQFSVSKLHAHQELCRNTEGSVMFAAPTGSGKTEAALLWAARQSAEGTVPRIYYVLPYQASMNAMQERLSRFFPESVGLQHGKSRFALYKMFLNQEYTPSEARRSTKLANNLTRLHFYPVRVLSPYQMLGALYRLKGYETALNDVFGAIFIFDEIHAYEVERLALILQMIRYLGRNYGVRFCFMSATFPDVLRNWLHEVVPELQDLEVSQEVFEEFRRHRLVLIDGELHDESGIKSIVQAAQNGSVLVCCNTVKQAQRVYRKLKQSASDLHLKLLHGRFNAKDRILKEQRLLSQMGTGKEPSTEGIVLVATQVVEVSLDIDFDAIFTEPAPLDALLQRFGRVNRGRRHVLCDVRVFKEPRTKTLPYDELLVQRTLDVLERIDGQAIDEALAREWLNEIYAGEVAERWKEIFKEQSRNFRRSCVEHLIPFQSDSELEKMFYAAFDGTEVVPISLEKDFKELQNTNPLLAGELTVGISWAQFMRLQREQLVEVSEDWPKIVNVPYDEEFGLILEANNA